MSDFCPRLIFSLITLPTTLLISTFVLFLSIFYVKTSLVQLYAVNLSIPTLVYTIYQSNLVIGNCLQNDTQVNPSIPLIP
ncbi:hypothetical protein L596_025369 [Steinernema carpocapsae]|nr:hypothetical protein L596_025369 [Steinernema carpocapsae]